MIDHATELHTVIETLSLIRKQASPSTTPIIHAVAPASRFLLIEKCSLAFQYAPRSLTLYAV